MGCDGDLDYQPPYANSIADGSKAVWEALDVSCDNWGEIDITQSDAQVYPTTFGPQKFVFPLIVLLSSQLTII